MNMKFNNRSLFAMSVRNFPLFTITAHAKMPLFINNLLNFQGSDWSFAYERSPSFPGFRRLQMSDRTSRRTVEYTTRKRFCESTEIFLQWWIFFFCNNIRFRNYRLRFFIDVVTMAYISYDFLWTENVCCAKIN